MALNWNILNLVRNSETGGVVKVFWQVKSTDKKSLEGSLDFIPNPSDSGFIAYSNLQESDVLNWVWSKLNKEDIENELNTSPQSNNFEVGKPWRDIYDN